MVETINRFNRAQRKLMHDLGREPTPDEVAKELGIDPDIKLASHKESLNSQTKRSFQEKMGHTLDLLESLEEAR